MTTRWYIVPLLLLLAGGIAYGQSGAATQPPDEKAPQNLDWTITQEGKVQLNWDEPVTSLDDLQGFTVWRSPFTEPPTYSKVASTNFERTFTDLTVKPGDTYTYLVYAVYPSSSNAAFTTVIYPDQSPYFEITSTPPPTVKAGQGNVYLYNVEYIADAGIISVEPSLEGAPEGMETWVKSGKSISVEWPEPQTGVYNFTIVLSGKDSQSKPVKATQNIHLVVAPRTGAIDIKVTNIHGEPIPYSHIQLSLLPDDEGIADTKINITTDEYGSAAVSDVPVGTLIAYCYPGDEQYASRYYNLFAIARSLSEADPQVLTEDEVLNLDFKLVRIGDDRATVSGRILNEFDNTPINGAKVHFIRKNNFILLGDDNLRLNPALLEGWGNSKIDTTLVSGADGEYSTLLPAGIDYFIVVEKEGYYESFNPDLYYNTIAIEARPFSTEKHTERKFTYRLVEKTEIGHSVQGVVRREDNNLNEPATVLLIPRDMKLNRGTGGGQTYSLYKGIRSVLTDSNGVYEFKNIPQDVYILLAIPLNRDVVPQYFTGMQGGAMTFENSGLVTVTNTIQGKDFVLKGADNDGLGTAYGLINLYDEGNDETTRLSGAVVCVIDKINEKIVGYSVSDTLGKYTIPNLRPGTYDIIADHPAHGFAAVRDVTVEYTTLSDPQREQRRDLNIVIAGTTGIESFDPSEVPAQAVLHQNFPNPFNPSTNIKFGISKRVVVKLAVFNAFGQQVEVLEEGELIPGTYSFQFDASNLASGMYYYRLTAGNQTLTRSMMLVK